MLTKGETTNSFLFTYPNAGDDKMFYVSRLDGTLVQKVSIQSDGVGIVESFDINDNGSTTYNRNTESYSNTTECTDTVYVRCSSNQHSFEDGTAGNCLYWTQSGGSPPSVLTLPGTCDSGGGGGLGGGTDPGVGDPSGNPGTGGGNSFPTPPVGEGNNPPIGMSPEECVDNLDCEDCNLPGDTNNDCNVSQAEVLVHEIKTCLGISKSTFLDNAPLGMLQDIHNHLTQNQCSEQAQILAILAIENNVDIDDLIYVIESEQDYRNQMSDDELNLFDTLSYEQQTLYLVSAKQAFDKTNELFPTFCERYNGKGDAFRHAYWNALSSQRIGVGLTNLLTTRHGNRPPLYAYESKEVEMDLFNNQVGRDIVYNGMTNLMLMQQTVQDALDNGHLRYLTNLSTVLDHECEATFSSQLIPTNL